jgi:UPF0176 protein
MMHSAFYKFVVIDDPQATAIWLRQIFQSLDGVVLVANEGINGTLAGPEPELAIAEAALLADARFCDITFKHSQCITAPFGKLKVHCKPEIVAIGVPNVDAISKTGINLSPSQWREFIASDDVVIIDNRNSFEYRLGHFAGAIDPGVSHYKNFADYIQAELPRWQAQGKRLGMYCTGGIRCEKTSAWMKDLGVDVYQLEGGILNYFQALPDASRDFLGECFVFDNRISLDTKLNETGTSLEQIYQAEPDGKWRIERAKRLLAAVQTSTPIDDCEL